MDRVPLRERNRQRVMQRIILAATDLFRTGGFHSTTMDDIANNAEISRATLFNYFPSKEALLLPWGQEIMEQQILPQLGKYLNAEPTIWQVFHFMFFKMNKIVQEYPDVIQAFVQEAAKFYHIGATGSRGMDPQKVYTQVILYGQRRGEIRTDLPIENLVSYLSALQMTLIFRKMVPTMVENSSLEIERLVAFLEKGLAQ
jgi:AcrR family transcriptional regulator